MGKLWFINFIGVLFSIIGFTQIGSGSFNICLIGGLTIQIITTATYYILKCKTQKADLTE
ncbi:hypothetical protein ACNRWW_06850 [Metabacillus sp. HB246100]|uniref:hypothetical protein n=1 Tax=Bacillus weihaiensis TaxID=1547283 RepID=UPI0023531F38|nr:hypothetical protein [Bacillus weihaiensis]